MKILTLNTWGTYGPYEKRWGCLMDELKRLLPDILFLQEVTTPELLNKIAQSIRLPFTCSSREAGLSLMSRFPLESTRVLKFNATSPTEHDDRRALVTNVTNGIKKIPLANTHLSWKPEDESIRLRQVQELLKSLMDHHDRGILAGDFNDAAGSSVIQEVENAGFVNVSQLKSPQGSMITWDNQNPFIQTHSVKFPDRQIDFLFLHENLFERTTVKTCKIVCDRPNSEGLFPSDHYGLLAEIEI